MSPNLASIRDRVNEFKGSRVRYKALKGRRKMEERMAVIVETAPFHVMSSPREAQFPSVTPNCSPARSKWRSSETRNLSLTDPAPRTFPRCSTHRGF